MDNAKEVLSMGVDLQKLGIIMTTTSPHTTELNGMYGRIKSELLKRLKSLLKKVNMNNGYCGERLQHAVYLQNRSVTVTLRMGTTLEVLLKKVPNNSRIGVLERTANVHIHKPSCTSKLGNHSQKGRFHGSRNGHHCVQVLKGRHVIETRRVSFDEHHSVFSNDNTVNVDIDTASTHNVITSDHSSVNEKRSV